MTRDVRSSQVVNIADLRALAQRRLPRAAFDYIDGGADAEVTLRENCRGVRGRALRPRCGRGDAGADLARPCSARRWPCRCCWRRSAAAGCSTRAARKSAARAAGAAGTVYVAVDAVGLPARGGEGGHERARAGTSSICAAAARSRTAAIERAQAAGYSALVVTIDTPVAGLRERDLRNGAKELLARQARRRCSPTSGSSSRGRAGSPAFLADGGLMSFPNVVLPGRADAVRGRRRGARAVDRVAGTTCAGSAKRGRVRSSSRASTPARTRAAPSTRAPSAVVVSNHGGRQLDGVAATLRVLPEVVAAVSGRTEVLLDGGIRRGSDVVKALCLGARAVLVGRAYAYGLGGRRRGRRHASDRHPARRPDAHDQAPGLSFSAGSRRVVHRPARALAHPSVVGGVPPPTWRPAGSSAPSGPG